MFKQIAQDDFNRASRKAFRKKINAWLSGKSNELLPFHEVRNYLPLEGHRYIGLKTVPIDQIVGSVGRYHEFDREFLPVEKHIASRWINIDRALYKDVPLPPVDLYKIGEVYFVKDGNHRVSVGKERGQTDIDAYVTEIDVPIPITPDTTLDDLALQREALEFNKKTSIDQIAPQTEIVFTFQSGYKRLLDHIDAHRWFLGEQEKHEIPYPEAVKSWVENVYLPLVQLIEEKKLLERFPGQTPADLYLWVSEFQWLLREAYEEDEEIKQATIAFRKRYSQWPAKKLITTLSQAPWVKKFILDEERKNFLKITSLDQIRPDHRIELTLPGKYEKIIDHINEHRWFMREKAGAEVSFPEAVAAWYEDIYAPIIEIIQTQNILHLFPNRTPADLYIWIMNHRSQLASDLGWEIDPQTAALDLAGKPPKGPILAALSRARKKIVRWVTPDSLAPGPAPGEWRRDRLTPRRRKHLFEDLLIPIDGRESGWRALEQGILIARNNQARLHGLFVMPASPQEAEIDIESLQQEFSHRCREAGVIGKLAIEHGSITRRIFERARWVDLLVISLNYPPSPRGIQKLGSGFRTILRRSGRPVLAIRNVISTLGKVLLAYDGSPKADEGLYIATRLARRWGAEISVVTVMDENRVTTQTQQRARDYLQKQGVPAEYLLAAGDIGEVILKHANERAVDLIIIGGYGHNPVVEVMIGSTVDRILHEFRNPILISS